MSFSYDYVASSPDNPSSDDHAHHQVVMQMTTERDDDCLDCEQNNGFSTSLVGNQSNSFEDVVYKIATAANNLSSHNASDGEEVEDSELYVIPWSIIILWCFLYGGISAAALIGNTLVMWVVAISRTMRTVTNMFIANLALADFIIGLFTIPFQFQAALLQRWNLPDFMCAFCPFVQVLSVNVSVFTLSAIAVDRYRAVLYPLSPRVSKTKATWAIVTIWTMSVLIALPTELDYKVKLYEDFEKGETKPFCSNAGLSSTVRMYYSLSLLVIQYIFPLIILTGAYAHMTAILWGTTLPGNKEESRDAVVLRNKKKVIKMLALVVLLFAVCWLPLQLYNVLQIFIPSINQYKYINILWFCFHWLAMSNSCCNPFIYAIYNDKFQREFRTRLGYICKHTGSRYDDEPAECVNFSEASDITGTKVYRASYKFKNNLSVRYNHQNVYKNENERDHELNRLGNCDSLHRGQQRSKKGSNWRNNNQSYKFEVREGTQQVSVGINNTGSNLLTDEIIMRRNGTFVHQLVKPMKSGSSAANVSTSTIPIEARQMAVVCSNSPCSSANSVLVTKSVVVNDSTCLL